jgi:D-sedoheptulose 7-phosphate isomerase
MLTRSLLGAHIEQGLLERNQLFEVFFAREAMVLAEACQEMAQRFLRGGRLLAFGRGAYATDAQHVSVEFVHPVIVGKRALPALDLSMEFPAWLDAILRPEDIVMGFGPPDGDPAVWAALAVARSRGAMTFALPGSIGSYGARGFVFIRSSDSAFLYPPGVDGNPLSHAVGDGACVLRASGTRA